MTSTENQLPPEPQLDTVPITPEDQVSVEVIHTPPAKPAQRITLENLMARQRHLSEAMAQHAMRVYGNMDTMQAALNVALRRIDALEAEVRQLKGDGA